MCLIDAIDWSSSAFRHCTYVAPWVPVMGFQRVYGVALGLWRQDAMELSEEQQQGMVEARRRLLAEVAAVVQDRARVVSALSASTRLPLPAAIPGSSQQACPLASCPAPSPSVVHSTRPQNPALAPCSPALNCPMRSCPIGIEIFSGACRGMVATV